MAAVKVVTVPKVLLLWRRLCIVTLEGDILLIQTPRYTVQNENHILQLYITFSKSFPKETGLNDSG